MSREKAAYRKSPKEAELFQELKSFNFEKIFAEDLSVKEQIQTFAECNYLIGIHSTGLNNCFYMPYGSAVDDIISEGHNDITIYNLSQVSSQRYSFIVSKRLHEHPLFNFDGPDLDIPKIMDHIGKTLI